MWFVRRLKRYSLRKNYIPRNFRRINFFFNGFELIKIFFIFYLGRFRIELDLLQIGKLQILFIFVLRKTKFYFIYYRGGSIKPVTQLLLALRFYGSGSMQFIDQNKAIGYYYSINKT
jgi:hypothetical protein